MTPSTIRDPRALRLSRDELALTKLEEQSAGMFRLLSRSLEQYVVRFTGIPGLVQGDSGVTLRTVHEVEVHCGPNYPEQYPTCRFLTPIFHPNVYASGQVCMGYQNLIQLSLSDLMIDIALLIQCRNVNTKSPANPTAARWFETHSSEIRRLISPVAFPPGERSPPPIKDEDLVILSTDPGGVRSGEGVLDLGDELENASGRIDLE